MQLDRVPGKKYNPPFPPSSNKQISFITEVKSEPELEPEQRQKLVGTAIDVFGVETGNCLSVCGREAALGVFNTYRVTLECSAGTGL